MSVESFVLYTLKYQKEYGKSQREGQALFNALQGERPDLAARITGTKYDPFYKDENIQAFWDYLEKNW